MVAMMAYRSFCLGLAFFLVLCTAGQSFAALRLVGPDKAGKGNAFLAEAISDEPIEAITFFWRGKMHRAKAEPQDGKWNAKILLPVALAEKSASLDLGIGRKNKPEVRKKIAISDVERPIQRLTVDKKYVDPPASVKERITADREKVRAALRTNLDGRYWDLPLQRPVSGGISSQFGLKRVFNGQPRGEHKGLDLRGTEGTPIKACADGVVVLVDNLYYSGNTVYINHGEGVFSAYLHMSQTGVKPGERVRRGQPIGLVGATGRVTGPHLHLSMFAQGQPVDPLPLLEKTAGASAGNKGNSAK